MAQTELAQTAAAGSIAVFSGMGAVLAQYGTSPAAVSLALVGALLAGAELDPWRWRPFVGLVVFNSLLGVLGGAVLADWLIENEWLTRPPLVLVTCTFLVAWLGHDWLRPFKRRSVDILMSWLGRRK